MHNDMNIFIPCVPCEKMDYIPKLGDGHQYINSDI